MIRVSREAFEALVREAVDELPEGLRSRMSNVAVVVRDYPTRSDLRRARELGEEEPEDLFGLYHGIPLPDRGHYYDKALPDLITIYQEAHEWECDTLEELREEVRITVRHEIAHHFGIDDDRLEELGAY
jgi:predicted Zn-dependent protease with MMP-like domain